MVADFQKLASTWLVDARVELAGDRGKVMLLTCDRQWIRANIYYYSHPTGTGFARSLVSLILGSRPCSWVCRASVHLETCGCYLGPKATKAV